MWGIMPVHKSLAAFGRALKTEKRFKFTKRGNAFKIAAASAISAPIVIRTPVDTGLAKGSWRAGDKDDVVPTTIDKGGLATLSPMLAAIRRATPGQDIHIFNNIRYIGYLNHQRTPFPTRQQPPFWVNDSIVKALSQSQSFWDKTSKSFNFRVV